VSEFMLKLDNVHSYYGLAHVLHGVSISLKGGEAVAILGRNGAGKTTIVNSIMGLVHVKEGRVLCYGEDITGLPPYVIARKGRTGLVPSGRQIFPALNVIEHLRVPVSGSGRKRDDLLERCFDIFPELKRRGRQKASSLSGGEQQMLVIARALMMDPRLLLLDEPMEGLSPLAATRVAKALEVIQQERIGILLCETKVQRAAQIAKRAYVLETGKIVFHYDQEGLEIPLEVQQRYLGVAQ
jgi:branched-chain amino acid transport system ATP-binding protein